MRPDERQNHIVLTSYTANHDIQVELLLADGTLFLTMARRRSQ